MEAMVLEEAMLESGWGWSPRPRPGRWMPLWGEFRGFWAMTPAMQTMLGGGSEQVGGKELPFLPN